MKSYPYSSEVDGVGVGSELDRAQKTEEETNSEEQDPERRFKNCCVTNLPFSKICHGSGLENFLLMYSLK